LPSGEGELSRLTGTVQTRRPNRDASFDIPWSNVARWEPWLTWAGEEFDVDPFFMGAMIMIESDGNQYWSSGASGERSDVVTRDDGFGDGLSVGLLQVKPAIWQSLVPDADPYTPQGNIRLGTAIMAAAIRFRGGSWEEAIRRDYFPADDPNGTTQHAYVDAIRALVRELRANAAGSTSARAAGTELRAFLGCLHLKLGYPYVLATAGPTSFDCSGLVDFCYREATGREIPGGRGSWLQCHQAGRELGRNESLQPGDLLCFLDGQHVGVYTGRDTMINALNEDEGVRETDITTPYWQRTFDRARRLWED
jgi:hypothetical protein